VSSQASSELTVLLPVLPGVASVQFLLNDYFLGNFADEFMEAARNLIFETYCRIHRVIDLKSVLHWALLACLHLWLACSSEVVCCWLLLRLSFLAPCGLMLSVLSALPAC
jgi:hypothetical protein